MSNVRITNDELRINGRLAMFPRRVESVSKDGCRFVGKANGKGYVVYGGREAGGDRSDWFVQWDVLGDHHFPCKSIKECFKLIENA